MCMWHTVQRNCICSSGSIMQYMPVLYMTHTRLCTCKQSSSSCTTEGFKIQTVESCTLLPYMVEQQGCSICAPYCLCKCS